MAALVASGLAVVAVHHVVAADDDFANGLHVAGYVVHLRIHHVHFGADQGPARSGEVVEPVGFIGVGHGALGLGASNHGGGFGETVAGAHFTVERLLQAGDQLGRGGSAAGHDRLHAGKVEFAELGTIEQRVGHGGDQGHGGGFFLLNEAEDGGGLEAADHDVFSPAHGDALGASPAVGVEQGDGVQLDVSVLAGKGRKQGQRVHVKRTVRQHDAFGSAGAAAGVEELGDFIFVEGENIGTREAVARQQVFQKQVRLGDRTIDGDIATDAGACFSQLLDQRSKIALEHQHAGAGMIENGGEFGGLQSDIKRHGDGANQGRAVITLKQLMVVEAEISDAVAGANAFGKQPGGQTFATLSELVVGERTGA